ncbi:phage holin family protein [Mumia qirimensis]|uniref:phage holin family protein n=1 Tax=Mumia qirimensis TaxID=3234852 RepID=UPI00351D8DB6
MSNFDHGASPSRPRDVDDSGNDDTRSLGDIVGAIAKDLSQLVKQEMDLAKTELKAEATKAGKGAGLLGGAGVAAHLTAIALTFTVIWLLDNWMPIEVAGLILTIVWGAIAAVLGLRGRKELQKVDPTLETTQQTLKEDVQWAKAQKNS